MLMNALNSPPPQDTSEFSFKTGIPKIFKDTFGIILKTFDALIFRKTYLVEINEQLIFMSNGKFF